MKFKLFKILLVYSIFYSCQDKGVELYLAQYFQKGQKLEIRINDDEYVYKKEFKTDYNVNSPKLIKTFVPKGEIMKIHFKLGNKDTLVNLSNKTEKVLFGMDVNKSLFVVTDKDPNAWLVD